MYQLILKAQIHCKPYFSKCEKLFVHTYLFQYYLQEQKLANKFGVQ